MLININLNIVPKLSQLDRLIYERKIGIKNILCVIKRQVLRCEFSYEKYD